MILEICCGDIDSVGAALTGGAGRIELCCGLEAGGLTPSAGLRAGVVEKQKTDVSGSGKCPCSSAPG